MFYDLANKVRGKFFAHHVAGRIAAPQKAQTGRGPIVVGNLDAIAHSVAIEPALLRNNYVIGLSQL